MIKSITQKVSVRIAAGAVGVAMVLSGMSFALPAAAAGLTATQISSILSLLQSFGADQATINNVNAALNGQATTGTTGGTSTGGSCPALSRNLQVGSTGADVMALQVYLNSNASTQVAASGAGSPGHETTTFGPATKAAVIKFQTAHSVSPQSGYVGPLTRAAIAANCGGTSTGGTTGGTGTAAGTAVVSAAAQPANAIAPANASRVPFTAFTVTANGAPVTINSVTVQRQGPSLDTDFSGVVLVDASTGIQLGTARVLDANHNATIGTPITIPAGSSKTFWVAGNISATPGSGDVASFAVTAVNTASTVSGSLPIVGASNTMNSSLTIGTASITTSSFDPNTAGSQPIGTTGYRFTGFRIQAGSAEDVTLKSITWYQSGSASGIQNVVTVVNGTSYPTTLDSTGRYYSTVFPTGIVIPKGQQLDVYVQGDLGANTTANTFAEFDIYRSTDIYLVGNTYGYGITPTVTASTGAYQSGSSHPTIFVSGTNPTPFMQGSTVTVTAGQFSTIQNATSVGAQNIAVNVPNQPLGGFQTNLTGEGIQVQSLAVHFTVTSGMSPLQNVSLVDENGAVVSGPYNAVANSATTQTVTFTGAINFPTGTHTYTLKGQLQSTTTNGATVQANTNPSSDWTNVTGQTTGNTVSISQSTITMNTMTVQAVALKVANGTTPTSQAVVAGGQNIQFATIQLDASQSGEDVRLSSVPLTITTNDTIAKLSNCQLWNGTTALNTGTYVINGSNLGSTTGEKVTFNFNNSLTVPKGTVMALSLTCSLSSSATSNSTYVWAADPTTTDWSPVGVTSGSSVTGLTVSGTAPTMTVSSGATLAISTDPSSPAYSLVAGGSTGVTLDVIKFHPSNEGVNLQKLGLQLTNTASSSASDLSQVYVYAGNGVQTTAGAAVAPGTLLGTLVFTGGATTGTSTLSQIVQLPVNVDSTLVIKGDVADIGTSQPGTQGHLVAVDYLNSQGVGANSGSTINSGVAGNFTGGTSAGVRTFNTTPTVALGPSVGASPNGTAQPLKKFSITAGSQGSLGLYQVTANISTSTGVTINNVKLFAYTDSGYSQPANVPGTSGGLFGSSAATVVSGTAFHINQGSNAPLEIGAGQTMYFTLVGDVSVSGQSTWSVNTTIQGDSSYPSLGANSFMGQTGTTSLSSANFVWSPNATTTSGINANDWTNGYGITGLPSTGI